jgi:hypothetical protein
LVSPSRAICPSRACAKALPIVLVLIAATNMAATIPITNLVHSVGMTASIRVLSIPTASRPLTEPGRGTKATYPPQPKLLVRPYPRSS